MTKEVYEAVPTKDIEGQAIPEATAVKPAFGRLGRCCSLPVRISAVTAILLVAAAVTLCAIKPRSGAEHGAMSLMWSGAGKPCKNHGGPMPDMMDAEVPPFDPQGPPPPRPSAPMDDLAAEWMDFIKDGPGEQHGRSHPGDGESEWHGPEDWGHMGDWHHGMGDWHHGMGKSMGDWHHGMGKSMGDWHHGRGMGDWHHGRGMGDWHHGMGDWHHGMGDWHHGMGRGRHHGMGDWHHGMGRGRHHGMGRHRHHPMGLGHMGEWQPETPEMGLLTPPAEQEDYQGSSSDSSSSDSSSSDSHSGDNQESPEDITLPKSIDEAYGITESESIPEVTNAESTSSSDSEDKYSQDSLSSGSQNAPLDDASKEDNVLHDSMELMEDHDLEQVQRLHVQFGG